MMAKNKLVEWENKTFMIRIGREYRQSGYLYFIFFAFTSGFFSINLKLNGKE